MATLIHKTGSIFNYPFEVYNDDGTPLELPATDFACWVNDFNGVLIANLVIADTDVAHIKALTYSNTSDWPEGLAKLDIRYPNDGEVTETFSFQIQRSETPRL